LSSTLTSTRAYWSWQGSNSFNSSLLNLTTFGLVERGGLVPAPLPWLEVVVVSDVRSACLFWNLRASRALTLLGRPNSTIILAASPAAFGRPAILDALVAAVGAHKGRLGADVPVDLAVIAADATTGAMVEAVFAAHSKFARVPASRILDRVPGGPPPPSRPDTRPRWALLTQSHDEAALLATLPRSIAVATEEPFPARVGLHVGPNAVPYTPPATMRNPRAALVARDLEGDIWDRYPHDTTVADLIVPGAAFRERALTVRVAQADRPGEVAVDLPDEWAALSAYFGTQGFRIDPSAAGTAGAAVLGLLGGVTGLDRLAAPLTYRLLQVLAPQNSKKVAQRVGRQVAALDGREDELVRALVALVGPDALLGRPLTFAELRSRLGAGGDEARRLLAILADLCAADVLLRGYHLPCPRCATREWYPLAEARERLICPGCGVPFPLPVAAGPDVELPWHYRPNGLISRAVDLDVLPHLLTLRHWAAIGQRPSCIVTGLEFRVGTRRDAALEFDLLFVSDGVLHAAECKAGGHLTEKDFTSARRAADLGVARFAFATAAEAWEPAAAAAIAALEAELAGRVDIHEWTARELLAIPGSDTNPAVDAVGASDRK